MKKLTLFLSAILLISITFSCDKSNITPNENFIKTVKNARIGAFEKQVAQEDPTSSIFIFFKYNAKKAKPNSLQLLTKELAPVKPVILTNDVNQTPIVLPGVTMGINQLYSTFGNFYFPVFKSSSKDLNKAFEQRFMGNFRSPEGTSPGDLTGKTVHVHFNKPASYFGAWFSGNFDLSLTEKIQYIINGVVVAEVDIADGKLKFLGVNSPETFTDLDIVPVGGLNQAYMLDRPSFK